MGQIIFALTHTTPHTWGIGQTGVMANKEGKGLKFINYYRGQDSIFVEDILNKDIAPTRVPDFEFNPAENRTELIVNEQDANLVTYLKAHPEFKRQYKVVSEEILAEEKLEKYEKIDKALELIRGISDSPRAAAVAILGFDYFGRSESTCKADLKEKANVSPDTVINIMLAPNFDARKIAALAFCNNIIKNSDNQTEIVWADNGGVILNIATGENALEKITDFLSQSTQASITVFQEISARADKKFSKPLLEVDARDAEIAALKAQLAAAQASPAVPVKIALTDHTLETATAAYIAQENVEVVPTRYRNDLEWIVSKLNT